MGKERLTGWMESFPLNRSPGGLAVLGLFVLLVGAGGGWSPLLSAALFVGGMGGVMAMAALVEPRLPLFCLAFTVTVFWKDDTLIDLGLALTPDRLFVGLLALGFIWRMLRLRSAVVKLPLALPMVALLLAAGLGLLHSLRPLEAVLQQFYNLAVGLLVLVASRSLVGREERSRWLAVLVAAAAYVAVLGLWETISGRYIFPAEALHYRGNWLRAASTFRNPVPFGAYLAMMAPVAWSLLGSTTGRWARIGCVACLAAILLGLAASFSRQAYLALFAAVVAMAGVRRGLAGPLLGLAAAGMMAVLTSALWLGPVAAVFFDYYSVTNIYHRLYMSRVALHLMIENPILGVGLGSFRELAFKVNPFGGLKTPHYGQHPTTHDAYLTLGAELGLPGLLLFAALIVTAIGRAALACRTAGTKRDVAMEGGLLGGIVAFAVGSLFLNCHEYLGLSTVFFFLVGLGGRPGQGKALGPGVGIE